MLEDWIADRLSREATYLRKLSKRACESRDFRTSPEFVPEIENTTESIAFCIHWILNGKPIEFLSNLGFEWDVLRVGAPAQRVALQLQAVEAIIGESRLMEHLDFDFDAFISHASEDKDEFVRPLVEELSSHDLRLWYDELSLQVGDSLRESINTGLSRSRYGIVVISPAFLSKNWTQHELDGLVARQMEGAKVILPVWHKITYADVLAYSPPLANTVALDSSTLAIEDLAFKLHQTIRGIR
ncbi:MAG: toll/interleukin-1 receptor domain-containing protein [Pirellulales bacterium]|nr:toll/interleukin-1 receptor domain-containing protein [Pirellulales bacterium]